MLAAYVRLSTIKSNQSFLLPTAFDKHVAVMTVLPAWRHPNGMRMWRFCPTAGFPNVGVSVPAVITADPDVTPAGSNTAMFDDGPWRSDFDYHFGSLRRPDGYGNRKQRG
jgi:hypothetical protein